jgi:hypothetical protein
MVIVAALALVATGVVYADIPGSDGLITACRDTKTGILRAIDADAGGTSTACFQPRVAVGNGLNGIQLNRGVLVPSNFCAVVSVSLIDPHARELPGYL